VFFQADYDKIELQKISYDRKITPF